MSPDQFTEVSSESWFGRLGGAFKGILFGLILVVVAFPVLFINEGRAVKRYKTLKEGGGLVVSVTTDAVNPANDGKLVHLTGKAETDETLTDPVFGISVNALRLNRNVEMYQWQETTQNKTKKKLGGGTETVTTYSYNKTWSDQDIRSGSFKEPAGHENPASLPYPSTQSTAKDVTLGAFALSSSLVKKINDYEPFPVSNDAPVPDSLMENCRLHNAGFYIGGDPASPQVGDTKIRFEIVLPTEASVISKQTSNTFEPYGTKAGGTIELLQTGVHTADAMIQTAQDSNKLLTWILRAVGFVLMFVGLNMIFRPLSVLADVLPILGNIVGAGTGVIAFLLAAGLSAVTVAVAWFVYRPLLSTILLVIAAGLAIAIRAKLKSSNAGTAVSA
jgi:hypothetical protein